VAKRAYRATQPTEREVQTGVRRARLSLRRGKSRSKWWLKGLVFVVLALGSLAYAKPHALSDLIEQGAPWREGRQAKGAVALASHREREEATEAPTSVSVPVEPTKAPRSAEPSLVAPTKPKKAVATRKSVVSAPSEEPQSAPIPSAEPLAGPEPPRDEAPVSEWGRVGQALARGDEASALNALGKLADSSDPRTRDKAEWGRAQLMMAHGNRDRACAIARSLTQRRSGSRIERQAQVLLKDCTR
jgi:hypothetical protein